MRCILCYIIGLLLVTQCVFAGVTGKIAGHITDKHTGDPLQGANIIIEGTTMGSASDLNGDFFIINIPAGVYKLRAIMTGYKTLIINAIRVNPDITVKIDFAMIPEVLEGDSVVIVAERIKELNVSAKPQSQAITQPEKAIYHIEVIYGNGLSAPVKLSVDSMSHNLSYELKPQTVSSPGLAELSVRTGPISESYREYMFYLKAEMNRGELSIIKRIPLSLIVANPDPGETMVTLTAGTEQPLTNGKIQPISGRIIPPREGHVLLKLLHQDEVELEISLPVDEQGNFSHNYVFKKSGRWQAFVDWQSPGEIQFSNNNWITFDVDKRRTRISMMAVDPRNKEAGDRIQINGQVVTEEKFKTHVRLNVVSPSSDTTLFIEDFDVSDSISDTFQVNYEIQIPGRHKMISKLIRDIRHSTMPLLLISDNNETENSEGEEYSCEFEAGTRTNDYAIILIGGTGGTGEPTRNQQNEIAELIVSTLLGRGFHRDDILLLSQTRNVGDLTRDGPSCDYENEIDAFLDTIENKPERNLLVYIIGQSKNDEEFTIYKSVETPGSCPQNKEDIYFDVFFNDSGIDWFNEFRQAIYIAAFDYGGNFLSELKRKMTKGYSGISNTGRNCTAREGNWMYPTGSFSATFFRNVAGGYDIHDAFYDTRDDFGFGHSQEPWLDDNGEHSRPDGLFVDEQDSRNQAEDYPDGPNSVDLNIGINACSERVPPECEDSDAVGSPAGGPILSDQAFIMASFDDPNDFLSQVWAKVIPPKNSNQSLQVVSLQYDENVHAYKSEDVNFTHPGLYHISIYYRYDDGTYPKYRIYAYNKYRYGSNTLVFFDPHIEFGVSYYVIRNVNLFKNVNDRIGLMIGFNLFSTRCRLLKFLGFGISSNFDQYWGLFIPASLNISKIIGYNFLWVYGGMGYEYDTTDQKFMTNDVKYFIGVKSRLFPR